MHKIGLIITRISRVIHNRPHIGKLRGMASAKVRDWILRPTTSKNPRSSRTMEKSWESRVKICSRALWSTSILLKMPSQAWTWPTRELSCWVLTTGTAPKGKEGIKTEEWDNLFDPKRQVIKTYPQASAPMRCKNRCKDSNRFSLMEF